MSESFSSLVERPSSFAALDAFVQFTADLSADVQALTEAATSGSTSQEPPSIDGIKRHIAVAEEARDTLKGVGEKLDTVAGAAELADLCKKLNIQHELMAKTIAKELARRKYAVPEALLRPSMEVHVQPKPHLSKLSTPFGSINPSPAPPSPLQRAPTPTFESLGLSKECLEKLQQMDKDDGDDKDDGQGGEKVADDGGDNGVLAGYSPSPPVPVPASRVGSGRLGAGGGGSEIDE
ncbi:unnamed protein product [Vitrella brassicaformis CCMP3155]|uniref:Uncharacterized protein n=1 Tax=Vitrella brassicaformis (strain CCMP3155) TaxID=1169540 RepID=A0A0G4F2T7_VITBC|nr:unnamed protein product [Vitrella brassicaformis CCMP3155]|eukprot:CEM05709.1 unnamed protein product [Vitrella brassicaformis CCMP3155]